jgi:hypothetical protein
VCIYLTGIIATSEHGCREQTVFGFWYCGGACLMLFRMSAFAGLLRLRETEALTGDKPLPIFKTFTFLFFGYPKRSGTWPHSQKKREKKEDY